MKQSSNSVFSRVRKLRNIPYMKPSPSCTAATSPPSLSTPRTPESPRRYGSSIGFFLLLLDMFNSTGLEIHGSVSGPTEYILSHTNFLYG